MSDLKKDMAKIFFSEWVGLKVDTISLHALFLHTQRKYNSKLIISKIQIRINRTNFQTRYVQPKELKNHFMNENKDDLR